MKWTLNSVGWLNTGAMPVFLSVVLSVYAVSAEPLKAQPSSSQADDCMSKQPVRLVHGIKGRAPLARKHSRLAGEPTSTVIIQFSPGVTPGDVKALVSSFTNVVVSGPAHRHAGRFTLKMSSVKDAGDVVEKLSESAKVVWAEVNYRQKRQAKLLPSDSGFANQWYLHNTGQALCMTNRDICAEKAWDITLGTSSVVVAVLDDGFDLSHTDLAANVFTNSGECGGGKESNGIDDDGNGYTNDWRGWNFVDNNNDPSPQLVDDNHGTVMAGLIAASINNGTEGIAGIAGGCRFLPIRISGGSVTSSDWADAIEYAAQFADVIAISYRLSPDEIIYSAFDYALVHGRVGKGCVICCAIGNNGVFRRYTTDAATAPEVITVGGSSGCDKRSWFSDYGSSLNLVCPAGGSGDGGFADTSRLLATDRSGADGYSTDDYAWREGTSCANALAAGVAALIISKYPSLSGLEVRRILETSCDKIDAGAWPYNERGWNEQYGFGRINAYTALTATQYLWDVYEPDDAASNATWITDGEIQYRSLSSSDDLDWAGFSITSSTADVLVTVLGTTGTWLRLYNSETNLIAEDDCGCPGYSYLTRTLSSGEYFVKVASSNNASIPYYGLHLAMWNMVDNYENDNTNISAKSILPGEMQFKTLYPSGDVDYVTFTLGTASKVEIRTMGELDGYLELSLLDGGGMIGYDYHTNATAHISTQLVAGTYWIKVNDAFYEPVSSYQLLLETYSADLYEPDDTTNNAAIIRSGEHLFHTLYPTGDTDWVKFTLTNTANVLVMTDTINPLINHSDADTVMTLYRDIGSLQFVEQNDNGNNWYFSSIYKAELEPGNYYVKITGIDTNTVCADYYISLDVFEQKTVLEGFAQITNGMQMMWQGDAAFTYQVQYSSNLVNTQAWTVATNIEGRVGWHSWTDDGSTTLPGPNMAIQRFYRIIAK
ncbi:MAG: S8 family serine peptidase [Kiritimatiellae bacterium]|nr:S8 family serine peptidase [Kiritimatiellia bacterium]MDD5519907.1 S8 family serine peptidase [Kiritimatiellia bacterium]